MTRRAALLGGALVLAARLAPAADLLGEAAHLQTQVEERVRLVVAHRVAADRRALAADVEALDAFDRERRDAGLPRCGLADDVRYLAAAFEHGRDARRDALDDVLDAHPDPVVRRLAEHRLEADDAAAADRLLSDDRHNRRAGLVNDFIRPLGVFSGAAFFAIVNPFLLAGSAVDSLVTTGVNLWNYDRLSTPEREALARYRTQMRREPRTADAPEIVQNAHRLSAKRAKALCEDQLERGEDALDEDDLDHAALHLRAAAVEAPCAEKAARLLEKTDAARARRALGEDAALWPVDDPPRPLSDAEADDYRALLVTTALGEPGEMVEAASRFGRRHEESAFAPSAAYVVAVGRDLGGHHAAAGAALEALADDDDSQAGRHAAAVLASEQFGAMRELDAAERRHLRDTLRFIFVGGQMTGRTALHTATRIGASGLQAAETLGVVNVLGLLTRAFTVWRRDPVSNQEIIDRGEELLAREPDGSEAADVHARLADAYERAGNYERALMHHRATPDPSPKRTAKLEGRIADEMLARAGRAGDDPTLLQAVVRDYPDTNAAEEAQERLDDRPDRGMHIARDVLRAHPALLGPNALDLDPMLLDGERENGELAEDGVTLRPGELRVTVEDADGDEHVETHTLSRTRWVRASAAAQEVLYADMLTTERRDPEVGVLERYIPFYVEGSVGEHGVKVTPALKRRRYDSEDRELYE